MVDLNEYLAIQKANQLAEETLAKASERESPSRLVSRPTCLVTSFAKRSDVPEGTLLVKMTPKVINALAAMGLHEPISLKVLPGRWWKVNVDAAEVGECSEYGARFVTLFLTSEQLAEIGFEVVDGPFEPWANVDVSRAILKRSPGKYWDASISNRPLLPVVEGTGSCACSDDGYTSEDLLAALDAGQTITVFSGPYDTKDKAHYALDLRWEVPE